MGAKHKTILGKNCLNWCDKCNIPVIDVNTCPRCGSKTRKVELTPPWDVSPIFPYSKELIRDTFNNDFGKGAGDALVKNNDIMLVSKIFDGKRKAEIIFDGCAAAYLIYNTDGNCSAENTLYSASIIAGIASKKVVTCGKNPGRMVEIGRNLMVPGLVDASPDIRKGDAVIIRDTRGKAVGLGTANMSAAEMLKAESGMAVKNSKARMPDHSESPRKDWKAAIDANRPHMEDMVQEGIRFMKDTIDELGLPAVVSFSGGKDSEAIVLMNIDGKLNLPLVFMDSGLEFEETSDLVHMFSKKYNLKLYEEKVSTELFFENMKRFGPPAIGYRWCCKIHKLAPIFSLMNKYFPDGSLSFIGQRKYEAQSRKKVGNRWVNRWIPSNECASPIQDWNALHVWMYILMRKAPYNIWYDRGLSRIGCVLCPATNPHTIKIVVNSSDKAARWKNAMIDYQKSRGLPDEWIEHNIWRWKKIPPSLKEELEQSTGKSIAELTMRTVTEEIDDLTMVKQSGYSPCTLGLSTEAALSKPVDIKRLSVFAKALNRSPEIDEDGMWLSIGNTTVYPEGAIIAKGSDETVIEQNLSELYEVIIRSEKCIGCSSCAIRCPTGALHMVGNAVQMDAEKCISCKKCLGPCPAVEYKETDLEN